MTVEERLAVLEQAWAALQAQTPTSYYTSRHGGEEIDKGIDRAKEGGAIDAALAEKATIYTPSGTVTASDIAETCITTGDFSDYPPTYTNGSGTVITLVYASGWRRQIFVSANGEGGIDYPRTYERMSASEPPKYGRWVPQATATPPQEIDLPLASGYTVTPGYRCCYSKSQDGLVLLHLAVQQVNGNIAVGGPYIFTTLPVGYRPDKAVGYMNAQVSIAVNSNGEIGGYVLTQDIPNLIVTIPFYAAS